MRARLLISALVAITGLATPFAADAAQSPLFTAFRHVCIDTAGDIEAMRRAAEAENFGRATLDDTKGSNVFIEYFDQEGGRVLAITRRFKPSKGELPNVDETTCTYLQEGPASGLVEEAAQWAGTPARDPMALKDEDLPEQGAPMDVIATFFTFAVTAQGEHRNIAGGSDADYAEAFRTGAVYWLGVITGDANGFQLTYEKAAPTP